MSRPFPVGWTCSPHTHGGGQCPPHIGVRSDPQNLMAFGKKVFADEIKGQGEILCDQGGLWIQRVSQ